MASVRITYYNGTEATFDNATIRPTDTQYLILDNRTGKVRVRIGRPYVYDVDRDPAPRGFHHGSYSQRAGA